MEDRRKLYKKKKRQGRMSGCKERLALKLSELTSELATCRESLGDIEKEKVYWQQKFRALERLLLI